MEWVKLSAVVHETVPDVTKINCPNCFSSNFGFEYIGDSEKRKEKREKRKEKREKRQLLRSLNGLIKVLSFPLCL
ncbi:hypothetical protein ACFQZE_18620 [Paenibacillus sp. GCM10027627]